MHMVILAVELHEFSLKVQADLLHGFFEKFSDAIRDDTAPILGHKDQMDM
jgi:hypothetical protein